MQFNTTQEVKEWAQKAAASDYKKHAPIHTDPDGQQWQADKNPYCTQGARSDWQRGFNNDPPKSYELPTANDWSTHYQRGQAMAELLETMQNTNQAQIQRSTNPPNENIQ